MANSRGKLTRIEKRRRLEDLFDRGEYLRLGVSDGRPVVNPDDDAETMKLWIAVINPLQREMAVREAQAAMARARIEARDDEGSNQWAVIRDFVNNMPDATLRTFITELDENEFLQDARRDVLQEKEWEDFNALRDAMRQFEEAGSPADDPEWQPLLKRDERFAQQVLDRVEEIRNDALDGYKLMPRPALIEKAIDKRIEQAGSAAFMAAYQDWTLYYSIRDDEDHNELYFDNLNQVRSLPEEVQMAIGQIVSSFISDSTEAKNSQGAESGSVSSVPPAEQEISGSSTRVE